MIMPILSVKDLDASIAFYRDKLGFNLDMTMPDANGAPNFGIVSMKDHQGSSFGLQLDTTEHVGRGEGVVFMTYVREDVDLDSLYADVQAKGVPIAEPLKTEYWGDRLFSVKDPDGYFLTLCKTVKQMSVDEILEAGTSRAE